MGTIVARIEIYFCCCIGVPIGPAVQFQLFASGGVDTFYKHSLYTTLPLMRFKRSPVQSLSASPELFSEASSLFVALPSKRPRTSEASMPPLSLSQSPPISPASYDSDDSEDHVHSNKRQMPTSNKKPLKSADSKTTSVRAAKRFVSKAIGLVGAHSSRIPTHRELLHLGLTNAVQVKARKFLVSINGIAVNVRTRLCDPFKNLGELLSHLDSFPDESPTADVQDTD